MACGIPVLTSKAKPMTKLIDENKIGYYCDFDSETEIFNVFSKLNEIEWKKLGENGFNTFQNEFNWENDKKKLKEFVEEYI